MCSIYGAFGPNIDFELFSRLQLNAGDRGRDGGRHLRYKLSNGNEVILGNWRAAPTTELEKGKFQPYDGVVHNGTIANAEELGLRSGEIDSEVLPRVLNTNDLLSLRNSLQKIVGSYAIACMNDTSLFLACNYKPIYYVNVNGNVYFSSMLRHFNDMYYTDAHHNYKIDSLSNELGFSPIKLKPYSVLEINISDSKPSFQSMPLIVPDPATKRALVIASAGLDSTTVAYQLKSDGYDVHLLHFQYGCLAETRELEAIKRISENLGSGLTVLPLPYTQMAGSSAIMNRRSEEVVKDIQGAEYAHEWVPARNLVMLSVAAAFAEANNYHYIALGNNLEEAGAFPDNEEEFTFMFDCLLPNALQNGYYLRVVSPVGHLMKHEIVKLGLRLGVPYELTVSCYRDGLKQCGKCGPCYLRQRAFHRNGAIDPAEYESRLMPEEDNDVVPVYAN